uniref:uncharacterized protein LOC122594039 isoform X2 n=1 Tax=Erigeron canadensis TaxID=72917 RepID=UPI001CB91DAC|nr:uncharacterized protein LOC122594039 isoform X2 [Erigeron canadensis]
MISEVSSSSLHEVNNNLAATDDLYDVEVSSFIDCLPCGLTFELMGDLEKHLAIFHKETTRRFNLPTSEGTMLCILEKHVVMEHDEPQLEETRHQQNGQASSSSQNMAEPQEPVLIVNGKFKTRCTWCYKEFLCEAVDAETMAEAIGFMCPKCKRKVSGVLEKSCQGLVNNRLLPNSY